MNHLVHWLTAHTEYNLHSPFVFDLYTQVIHTRVKGHFGGPTYEQLYKFINHFAAHNIWLQQPNPQAQHAIELANSQVHYVSTPQEADFLVITNPQQVPTFQPTDKIIIFVLHPHHNKTTETAWNTLYTRLNARVSIDLYHTGILFFRHALSPQHFRLR